MFIEFQKPAALMQKILILKSKHHNQSAKKRGQNTATDIKPPLPGYRRIFKNKILIESNSIYSLPKHLQGIFQENNGKH
jgi:hypothetical protein